MSTHYIQRIDALEKTVTQLVERVNILTVQLDTAIAVIKELAKEHETHRETINGVITLSNEVKEKFNGFVNAVCGQPIDAATPAGKVTDLILSVLEKLTKKADKP